jgi:hypothetical protein
VMTVDEAQISRINEQAKGVQPLLQGIGDQIAKLSPQERKKWQEMLGDSISLDKIATAAEPVAAIRLAPAGATKVAGFPCRKTRLMQGKTPLAELCLAEQAAIKIPDNDYATIRSLLALYGKLADKSQKLARQIGLAVPTIAIDKTKGVPILVRDLSRDEQGSATLCHVNTAPVAPESMLIPSGYAAKPLTLW